MGVISIYESHVPCLSSIIDLQRNCQNESLNLSEETNKCLLYLTLKKVGASVAQKAVSKLVAKGELTWTKDEEFEVEQILDYIEEDGVQFYLIKWKGWSHAHNSWEPKENIDCENLMEEYHMKNDANIQSIGSKRKFDYTKCFEERETKKQRIDELFEKLKSSKEMITPLQLILLTSPDKGKKSYKAKGVVSCEGLKVPKYISTKALNRNSKSYKQRKSEIRKALQEWEKHLNIVSTDPASITVENDADLEGPPENFIYINDYKPGDGIDIPNDPVVGCECTDCTKEKKSCCAAQFGVDHAYYSHKRLRINVGRPIYECNKRCKCGPECANRVVQQGRKHKVCVFRTKNGRGWGVKTLQKIKKGTFVMEYVGEVISNTEAEIRGKTYDSVGRTYLFDLDFNDGDCPFTVDAAIYGNVSHFVNHSCDPNLEVYSVWINTLDPRLPRIALFSRRDIEKGEELTFDYMSNKVNEEAAENVKEANNTNPETPISDGRPTSIPLPSTDINSMDSQEPSTDINANEKYQDSNTESLFPPSNTPTESQMTTTSDDSGKGQSEDGEISETSSEKSSSQENNSQKTQGDEVYRMVCQCGAKNCRKFVF